MSITLPDLRSLGLPESIDDLSVPTTAELIPTIISVSKSINPRTVDQHLLIVPDKIADQIGDLRADIANRIDLIVQMSWAYAFSDLPGEKQRPGEYFEAICKNSSRDVKDELSNIIAYLLGNKDYQRIPAGDKDRMGPGQIEFYLEEEYRKTSNYAPIRGGAEKALLDAVKLLRQGKPLALAVAELDRQRSHYSNGALSSNWSKKYAAKMRGQSAAAAIETMVAIDKMKELLIDRFSGKI